MRQQRSVDLICATAAALALLALAAVPFDGLPEGLILVPLVLFLPGYSMTAAMFPPGTIARGERLVYAVTLSVGVAALGGLAYQLIAGLNRFAWACVLVSITLLAAAIAQRRRSSPRTGWVERPPALPRIGVLTTVAMLVAMGATAWSINLAVDGLHAQRAESHFTSLWVAPGLPGSGSVEIGIGNHQEKAHAYALSIALGRTPIRRWQGRLGPYSSKQLVLAPTAIPPKGELVVILYKDGTRYRRAELPIGGGA